MEPFVRKYAPKKVGDIVGQDRAIAQLDHFISSYKTQKKKAAFIHGPCGCGKTSSVYVLAEKYGYEVVEVNASDFRNADAIQQRVGGALAQQSLFYKGKIILIDEVDGLSGYKDRGGVPAVVKLLAKSTFPVILTAIDPYQKKLSSLRSKSSLIEFYELDVDSVLSVLKNVCGKESITYDDFALRSLARHCAGDMRVALNNLQIAGSFSGKLTRESLDILSDHDKQENMMQALNKILKTTKLEIAISAFNRVKEDIDEQFLWMEENTAKEYKKAEDVAAAYDCISKADIFRRRIRRWQHYRFYVYISALLSGGIALSKDEKYKEFVSYGPSGRILKLWWAKQKTMKKKAIAEKIAYTSHTSTKRSLNFFPYFLYAFRKDKAFQKNVIEEFELEKDHVDWLNKQVLSV